MSYFFAKDASMLPQLLLGPLVYCVVFLNITSPRASFSTYYWALFGENKPPSPSALLIALSLHVHAHAMITWLPELYSWV